MALIRKVTRHPTKNLFVFMEMDTEDKKHQLILGGKEFSRYGDAVRYSKGFEPGSYIWHEGDTMLQAKLKDLWAEKERLLARIHNIDLELHFLLIDKVD